MFQRVFRAVIEQIHRGPARKSLVSVEFPAVPRPCKPTSQHCRSDPGRLENLLKPVFSEPKRMDMRKVPSETLLKTCWKQGRKSLKIPENRFQDPYECSRAVMLKSELSE